MQIHTSNTQFQFSNVEILEKICQAKLRKMQKLGYTLGHNIPIQRKHPIIKPFILQEHLQSHIKNSDKPFIIAEIKRASPARGKIANINNPIQLAQIYIKQGVDAISILCEEDYFQGSLQDLQNVKNTFPQACILCKWKTRT